MATRKNFPHRIKQRREDANKRNEEFAQLSLEQQLQVIDQRLGKELGASKQRAKIAMKIRKRDDQARSKKKEKKE